MERGFLILLPRPAPETEDPRAHRRRGVAAAILPVLEAARRHCVWADRASRFHSKFFTTTDKQTRYGQTHPEPTRRHLYGGQAQAHTPLERQAPAQ